MYNKCMQGSLWYEYESVYTCRNPGAICVSSNFIPYGKSCSAMSFLHIHIRLHMHILLNRGIESTEEQITDLKLY